MSLINAKERYPIHEAGHGIAALILGKLCFINLDERSNRGFMTVGRTK